MKQHRSVLFVCTGNICRSPTAEAVLRHLAREEGIELRVESRGTQGYHAGDAPDPRAQRHALKRGYDLSAQRARQVAQKDFEQFDLIIAMDRSHLAALKAMCPPRLHSKVRLFKADFDVPDPYYGGAAGFESVLDLVEEVCRDLLQEIRKTGPSA
jgi:protein-tyrosine phosphatase